MRVRVFASGSKGNSLAVRSSSGALLVVDLGLSCKNLECRAAACAVALAEARGILFTHDHDDHFSALSVFHKRRSEVPLLANMATADAIAAKTGVNDGWVVFDSAQAFDFADFTITPFPTSHDAAEPVGFLIENDGRALFVGTDTGVVTAGARAAFARADCAILESNYDPVLLAASDRRESLKSRIAGRSGHLANEDAAALFRATNPPRLKRLMLAHISEECNSPSLARAAMLQALKECGRADVALAVLSQREPSPLVEF